ncbi:MAG: RloB domain-containing protein [Clostridiales bacterium]|nr:RloB domain-containing protein [Clostridiales bacterium]
MGSKRRGARKSRKYRNIRIPDLGYYLIVTDAKETEKNYFEGIKRKIPSNMRDRIVVKIEKTKTVNLVQRALELRSADPQYRKPWIVFDRDQVKEFDEIIKSAVDAEVEVGWSNPCIEIFLISYFDIMPVVCGSVKCCKEFEKIFAQKTAMEYDKSDKNIYEKLCKYGDESKALKLAETKHLQYMRDGKNIPSEMMPCTTVYILVKEINEKLVK